ncbi:MAG: hypothetical protein KHZ99_14045 [Clostridium sp.]|uniref:hypothetical protein n=1 Tax=Clostridium sp. TaxID=1506 RepID=UPI0025C33131|nr:hypothetical protein [Clostridium sp.]MBS4958153.1 hypothetical protein [Clostridium sp.]
MKLNFNKEQIELLNKIGFDFDVTSELSDDEIFEIDDKVSDYFAYNGLSDKDQVNGIGLICESIMDILGEL